MKKTERLSLPSAGLPLVAIRSGPRVEPAPSARVVEKQLLQLDENAKAGEAARGRGERIVAPAKKAREALAAEILWLDAQVDALKAGDPEVTRSGE